MSKSMQKLIRYIPIVIVVGIMATTSAFAAWKVLGSPSPSSHNIIDLLEKGEEWSEGVIPSTNTNEINNALSNNNSKISKNEYTLADLASHNTSSSCYVGYNGSVYNVTNHPSWNGCYHHGIRGGQDITSRFPHPISYLSGLPIVGKLTDGSTQVPNPNNGDDDHDDDHDDEYEIENENDDD